ncbi:MAG: enoyl-CoA hydratase/isomerase family protein [Chloroflexi bacterium]|nr:enoyl-CoA hydratase/isomerase family protein [Chloroflexota bacterium]
MTDSFVSSTIQDGVAYLTLNRPPVNVVHIPMLEQMETALTKLAKDTAVRVLVLQAEGKMFSAGVDVADHTLDKVGEMIPLFNRVCTALADFPTPTIAAVHGHALGGGCELVICCDLAVMAEKAKIGQPEIQLAAIAPIAALRLPYLVGYRAAADLMFNGRNLTAEEALNMGLVNAVVSTDQVGEWAQKKASHLAGLSRAAMSICKRALRMGFGDWANSLPSMEQIYLDELMATTDAKEGLAAFMERRQPVWKHK